MWWVHNWFWTQLQPAAGRGSGEDNFTSSILLILFNCTSHVFSESSSIYLAWDCSLIGQLMDGQWIKWSISVLRGCRVCLCLYIFCAAAAPPPPMMMGFWLRQSAMLNTCYYCHGLSIQLIITAPAATHTLVHWTIFSFPHKYFKQMFFVEVLMRIYLPWHQKLINFFLNIYHCHNINYCTVCSR